MQVDRITCYSHAQNALFDAKVKMMMASTCHPDDSVSYKIFFIGKSVLVLVFVLVYLVRSKDTLDWEVSLVFDVDDIC